MTQAEQVMNHFHTGRTLTSIEAHGLYGITRLAAVVHRLKNQGINVRCTMQDGVRAKYAEYSLY